MKHIALLSLYLLAGNSVVATAEPQSEEAIFQQLMTREFYHDYKAAAAGNLKMAMNLTWRETQQFCNQIYSKKFPNAYNNCYYDVTLSPKEGTLTAKIMVELAKRKLKSVEIGTRRYAKILYKLNQVADKCSPGSSQILNATYPASCQQEVICKGKIAENIQDFFADKNFDQNLGPWTRELGDEEKTILGMDITPLLKDPSFDLTATFPAIYLSNQLSYGSSNSVNDKLEKKMERVVEQISRKIARSPQGLSALLKEDKESDLSMLDVESLGELKESVAERMKAVEDGEDDSIASMDPKKLERYVDKLTANLKIAEKQISEGELQLLKFYKKHEEELKNPRIKKNTHLVMYPASSIPNGIMTLRGLRCETAKSLINADLKKSKSSCSLIYSNNYKLKYDTFTPKGSEGSFWGGKVSYPVVSNQCAKYRSYNKKAQSTVGDFDLTAEVSGDSAK